MGEEEEEEAAKSGMTPWEQHGNVISIPRFDYKAPSSLLQHSHSGFLITCTIRREKSATKEAMSILHMHCGSFRAKESSNDEVDLSDEDATSKRRRLCNEEPDKASSAVAENETLNDGFGVTSGDGHGKFACSSLLNANKEEEQTSFGLSLVKLTKSGLLLFTFPRSDSPNTVNILSNIINSLESRTLSSPLWCHRIFPLQATCRLCEKDLQAVVRKLVHEFVNDKQNDLARPIKFAVGYNRRGVEEREVKTPKNISGDGNMYELLDRNKCFSAVAAAVKDVISDSAVDLKAPELSVLIELLPLSAVPNGALVVGVSVLPQKLVMTKPKLSVKALVSDVGANNGKK